MAVLAAALVVGTSACQDFLDVNKNPNSPDQTTANNYLAPMMHWLATSEQFDGRFIGRYTQEFTLPSTTIGALSSTWDRHGYDRTSDNNAQLYRDVYWNFGLNLSNMINQSEAEERWDLAGIGHVLRAWGWLKLTDMHGDVIITEAFTPDKFRFAFDSQETAFEEVFKELDKGIELLARTDGKIDPAYVTVGDRMYNGSREKWTMFAWGLKALALQQFSNKASYNAQAVIDAVDKSFKSNADDAVFPYPNVSVTFSDDRNFWSVERQNACSFRQTNFVVGLMDGTAYPGAVDPRMTRMLAPDSTGTYHGVDNLTGYGTLTRERPWNMWATAGGTACPAAGTQGRYILDYRVKFPIMTYSQLQFTKAEAALKKGDQATARDAYVKGISSHIDFVNARNAEIGRPDNTQISAAEKNAFLANPAIVPATVTLSHILGQKYIAQWMWAHVEIWNDMRRYNYTDTDPVSGTQVFRNFKLPALNQYDIDNNGMPAMRARPRYNSDYVWNRDELYKIGGLALDYHTKPMPVLSK